MFFEGCYPDSIESQPDVAEMTMTISSLGMCQEICHHKYIHKFAVKVDIRSAQGSVLCINPIKYV